MDCTVRPFFTDAENRMVGEYRVPTFEEAKVMFPGYLERNQRAVCKNLEKGYFFDVPVDIESISHIKVKEKNMVDIIFDRDVTRFLQLLGYLGKEIVPKITKIKEIEGTAALINDPLMGGFFDDDTDERFLQSIEFVDFVWKYRDGKIDKCNGYYIPEPEYFVKYQYPDLSRVVFKLYHEDQSKEVREGLLNNENCAYFEMDFTGLDTANDPRKFIYDKIEEVLNSRHQII